MFPFLLCAVMATASAAERHLGPHVHGEATLDVSTEGNALDVQLSLPGHDAVGFEHPASTDTEKQALAASRAYVAGAGWVNPSPHAGCTLLQHTLRANGYDGAAEPGGHADFDAGFHFACAHPEQLDGLDVRLAQRFPSLQKIVVNTITASGSSQQILTGTATHVDLAP